MDCCRFFANPAGADKQARENQASVNQPSGNPATGSQPSGNSGTGSQPGNDQNQQPEAKEDFLLDSARLEMAGNLEQLISKDLQTLITAKSQGALDLPLGDMLSEGRVREATYDGNAKAVGSAMSLRLLHVRGG